MFHAYFKQDVLCHFVSLLVTFHAYVQYHFRHILTDIVQISCKIMSRRIYSALAANFMHEFVTLNHIVIIN